MSTSAARTTPPDPAERRSTEPDGSIARLSPAELRFVREAQLLGRLATSDEHGQPHVVPVGWSYNDSLGTFDISGRDFAATRKYRNVLANPRAALVIDDVLPPWQPRAIHIQGPAQALPADPASDTDAVIRIHPSKVMSWGLAAPNG
jgi:pyridoxamine 5'-phosphate oxidase family protein